jgi:hypothetical protein
MAIGNIDNVQQLNSMAAQYAGQYRSVSEQVMDLQDYVTAQGSAGLQALGFSSADATAFITQVSYLANIAGVIQGTATVASPFNFVNELIALTGPS